MCLMHLSSSFPPNTYFMHGVPIFFLKKKQREMNPINSSSCLLPSCSISEDFFSSFLILSSMFKNTLMEIANKV